MKGHPNMALLHKPHMASLAKCVRENSYTRFEIQSFVKRKDYGRTLNPDPHRAEIYSTVQAFAPVSYTHLTLPTILLV
eukprot:5953078-Amphidinium_carterae.1